MDTSRLWTASRRATRARNSTSESFISPTMSSSRSSRTVRDPVEVREQGVDLAVARGDVGGERARRRRGRPRNSSGVLRVRSASVSSDCASWSVSISLGASRPARRTRRPRRTASWCARPGSRRPPSSWPEPAGSSERYIAPSRVLTLIAALVSLPKSESVLTRKVTLTWSPSSSTRLDLADADAGDPDLVVGLEAAGLGEGGVVGVAAADQREVLGAEGRQDQQRDRRRGSTAPMMTGLRSRKGRLIRDHTCRCRCCSRPGRTAPPGSRTRPWKWQR